MIKEKKEVTFREFAFEKGLLLPVLLLNRLKILLGKLSSFLPKLTHLKANCEDTTIQ